MDGSLMTNYDVFNGDTDGIFAWHQLRLAHPRDAIIVTGVKRDVNLVARVNAVEGDLVTIMDGLLFNLFSIEDLKKFHI